MCGVIYTHAAMNQSRRGHNSSSREDATWETRDAALGRCGSRVPIQYRASVGEGES